MIFTKLFEPFDNELEQLYTEPLHENEQSTLVVERSKKYGISITFQVWERGRWVGSCEGCKQHGLGFRKDLVGIGWAVSPLLCMNRPSSLLTLQSLHFLVLNV